MIKEKTIIYQPGEVIFSEGDDSDAMYIIKEGLVRVKRSNDTHISTLGQNNLFGEIGFLNNEPRSATAIAELKTELWKLTAKTLEKELVQVPPWYQKFFKIVSQRLREANERLQHHSFDDDELKFAKLLFLLLSGKKNANTSCELSLAEVLDYSQLMLTFVAEEVDNLLQKLSLQKIISLSEERIQVASAEKLQHYCEYLEQSKVYRDKMRGYEKYHQYPNKILNIASSLIQAIHQNIFLISDNCHVMTLSDMERFFPDSYDFKDEDITLMKSFNLLSDYQGKQYLLNNYELETIELFTTDACPLKFITSDPFRKLLDYFCDTAEGGKIDYHALNQANIMLMGQEIDNKVLTFLIRLDMLEPVGMPDQFVMRKEDAQAVKRYIALSDLVANL